MKYTPGPWSHCPCGRCQLVWSDGEEGILIHDTPDDDEATIAKGEEAQGNCLLIAAAPDLYEALKTLASEEYRDDDDPILGEARNKARIAIAKAEGTNDRT